MSKALADYHKTIAKNEKHRKEPRHFSPEERLAYVRLRREAFAKGTKLKSGGRGGLSPVLVLRVFRRDDYQCKIHGDRGEGDFGGIELHHKAGILESRKLDKLGHANVAQNLATLCAKGHNAIHTKAREEGIDSSQVTPEGDYGTRRDNGDRGVEGLPWREDAAAE